MNTTAALRHPNVVLLLGAVVEPGSNMMVLEYADHGALDDVLKKSSDELIGAPARLARLGVDFASGLEYIHAQSVDGRPLVHRDVKCENALVFRGMVVKVSDMGLSVVKLAMQSHTRCGTPTHIAPEVANGSGCDEKADVFSFGIAMWQLWCRRKPYSLKGATGGRTSAVQLIMAVVNEGLRPTTHVTAGEARLARYEPPRAYQDLAEEASERAPTARPTMAAVRERLQRIESELRQAAGPLTERPSQLRMVDSPKATHVRGATKLDLRDAASVPQRKSQSRMNWQEQSSPATVVPEPQH